MWQHVPAESTCGNAVVPGTLVIPFYFSFRDMTFFSCICRCFLEIKVGLAIYWTHSSGLPPSYHLKNIFPLYPTIITQVCLVLWHSFINYSFFHLGSTGDKGQLFQTFCSSIVHRSLSCDCLLQMFFRVATIQLHNFFQSFLSTKCVSNNNWSVAAGLKGQIFMCLYADSRVHVGIKTLLQLCKDAHSKLMC